MGLSLGHGDAVYVGFFISILIGPTAFATPPMLIVFQLSVGTVVAVVARREAVVLPSVNAMLFETNRLRDDDDDVRDGSAVMYNRVAGT